MLTGAWLGVNSDWSPAGAAARQVFERIKQKGLTESGRLKQRVEDFGPADVTEEVRGRAKATFQGPREGTSYKGLSPKQTCLGTSYKGLSPKQTTVQRERCISRAGPWCEGLNPRQTWARPTARRRVVTS